MPDEWRLLEVTWPLMLAFDPVKRLRARRRQKMALGRYGRQSVLQWDDVELDEFLGLYEDLVEIIRVENAARASTEDT